MAVDGQVHVVNDRAFFYVSAVLAPRATNHAQHLLNAEEHLSPATLKVHHAHVFQAHQGFENFCRVVQDEGVFRLLVHISSLKHLRLLSNHPFWA